MIEVFQLSNSNDNFDPEIWTLSLVGDVFSFIDEAFLNMDIQHRNALRLYLDNGDLEEGLYSGVRERLLECIWQAKIAKHDVSEKAH
ncbi:MAG: hypothetical protein CBB68_12185 [Rhodospirillaceae bacterium TMED8]|nr:MAG: hypothetical protein CBB68_12185 [Rhodospirillaceae bacterium TMED8]